MEPDSDSSDHSHDNLSAILDVLRRQARAARDICKEEGPASSQLEVLRDTSLRYVQSQQRHLAHYGLAAESRLIPGTGAFGGYVVVVVDLDVLGERATSLPDWFFAERGAEQSIVEDALALLRQQTIPDLYSPETREDVEEYEAMDERDRIHAICAQLRRVGFDPDDVQGIEERVTFWSEDLAHEHDLATRASGTVEDYLAMTDRVLFQRALEYAEFNLTSIIESATDSGDDEVATDLKGVLNSIRAMRRERGF